MFSAKCRECAIEKRNGHGKVMEEYFVKSVGTLYYGMMRITYAALDASERLLLRTHCESKSALM